jgi:hypothetical protein
MKLSDLPLNQTVTIAQEAHCWGTATRLTEQEIELRYYAGAGDDLVQCATLFCTYPAAAARAALARVTLARMSEARAVQMNGFGSML